MLYLTTIDTILQHTQLQLEMLGKHRDNVTRFGELCTVLRQQGSNFTEVVDADETEINYHIYPENHGDYLAIVEAVNGMGAHRTICGENHMCDIVNAMPDAPTFWLHIPMSN